MSLINQTKELKQLYWVYHDAKRRCTNPKHKAFHLYGSRGIQFNFNSFKEWLDYMGPRPIGYEQDRINNDGNYEVGNVKWSTRSAQQKNKRIYKSNTSGITGVNFITTTEEWIARGNTQQNGKREYLYVGKDFFEACCARLSWETTNGTLTFRNKRGKSITRNEHTLDV
jgi:hypothetical protein